jgi:VWFA-related protein
MRVRLSFAVLAVLAALETAGRSVPSRAVAQVRDPTGIAWLIFVDDLHVDFRNTGHLRKLLKSISTDVIRYDDIVAVRSSGPPRLSIDVTADKQLLEDVIQKTHGNGLKASDIQAAPVRGSDEVQYRVTLAVSAASGMIDSVHPPNRLRALLYISNGYTVDASAQLSELTRTARRSNVTIFAIDPRGLPGASLADERSPATQDSLRAIAEPTGGFALLDETDVPAAMARIGRAMRAMRR